MVRPLAMLLALVACGGAGVCAGCGGDDGDVPPANVTITGRWATTSNAPAACVGMAGEEIAIVVEGMDTNAPRVGLRTCQPTVDDGAQWVVRCTESAVPIDIRIAKDLGAGSFDVHASAGGEPCFATYNAISIVVE